MSITVNVNYSLVSMLHTQEELSIILEEVSKKYVKDIIDNPDMVDIDDEDFDTIMDNFLKYFTVTKGYDKEVVMQIIQQSVIAMEDLEDFSKHNTTVH